MDSLKDLQDQIDKLKSEILDLKNEHILLREEVRGRRPKEREQAQLKKEGSGNKYDFRGFLID